LLFHVFSFAAEYFLGAVAADCEQVEINARRILSLDLCEFARQ
jgi:hypothetical protein